MPRETPLKLFLDECLSSDIVQSLRGFLCSDYPNLEIDHLADYFSRGEGDDVWIPKLQRDHDWIVVTKDDGRDPKKPKLPDICRALGITHVVISESIVTNTELKHALVTVMPQLLQCTRVPKGTQVRLNVHTLKSSGMPVPNLTIAHERVDLWCVKNKHLLA